MIRPLLLDLFCGLGGCSVGYARAGFDVVGVDVAPQPHYPFYEVIQGDALVWAADPDFMARFDAVHASPPCKLYTKLRGHTAQVPEHLRTRHDPTLLERTRAVLQATGRPYVIENVEGAPLQDPVLLCGTMFGLGLPDGTRVLRRHRLFESNVTLTAPAHEDCGSKPAVGVYGHGGSTPDQKGYCANLEEAQYAMGIWWGGMAGISQAIPPAYTQHLGGQLLRAVAARA